MSHKLNLKDDDKNFVGEGSYGCTYFPGIDCSGKKNKKQYLTKVEEINFFSNNEILISKMIKKLPKYSKYFAPILKNCVITFDKLKTSNLELDKCQTLFDGFSIKKNNDNGLYYPNIFDKFINNKYYLFSIKYIHNISLMKFYQKSNQPIELFNNFFIVYLYLLNSIYILNNNNIIHNDLHFGNILIKKADNVPIIIDFGLSYDKNKMHTQDDIINFNYMKNFYMDFREDQFNHILEKQFISFISDNKTEFHNIQLNSNFLENKLIQENIDYFIHDTLLSITKNELADFFTNKEIEYYKETIKKSYYKYLDKEKYKYYSTIINELLPIVFEFEDIYKLSVNYLLIYYIKQREIDDDIDLKKILNVFVQIIKKTLNPDPSMRFKANEINLIIKFIIKTLNEINIDSPETYKNFYKRFDEFIEKKNLPKNIIFQKDFSFIDFDSILNKNTTKFVKKSNIKI